MPHQKVVRNLVGIQCNLYEINHVSRCTREPGDSTDPGIAALSIAMPGSVIAGTSVVGTASAIFTLWGL